MYKFLVVVSLSFMISSLQAQVEGELLGVWSDPTLVGSTNHDNTYNEIWGYTADGREYAIIGTTLGTHFIDVTDPEQPTEVEVVVGGTQGARIVHRDYHNYGQYLYGVADEGNESSLQVMDMSTLPDSVTLVYDSKDLIVRAHNIFIDTLHERLYSLSSARSSGFTPLAVLDISDPANPHLIKRVNVFDGFGVTHVHDAFVEDHLAYLNCGAGNNGGLIIADMKDLENIEVLSVFRPSDYPQGGYNHSGWPNEAGTFYYMADENHGLDMKVMDVRDKREARFVSTFNAGASSPFSIPHNQVVSGDYLYVSYYFDGLQVYDISTPATPERVYFYDTSTIPHTSGLYRGAWGVYPFLPSGNILVSDMQNGLFVVAPVESIVANEETESVDISVFPNPSNGILHIDSGEWQGGDYTIYDLNGVVVQRGVVASSITLSPTLQRGVYVFQLRDKQKVGSSKFVLR